MSWALGLGRSALGVGLWALGLRGLKRPFGVAGGGSDQPLIGTGPAGVLIALFLVVPGCRPRTHAPTSLGPAPAQGHPASGPTAPWHTPSYGPSSGGSPHEPGAIGGEPVAPSSLTTPDEEASLRTEYAGRRILRRAVGRVVYYHDSLAGNPTASGEPYDPEKFTAAHRTLPFGTVVRVARDDGRGDVYVRINDRGPFGNRERIIDLSRAAAEKLGVFGGYAGRIRLEVLAWGKR